MKHNINKFKVLLPIFILSGILISLCTFTYVQLKSEKVVILEAKKIDLKINRNINKIIHKGDLSLDNLGNLVDNILFKLKLSTRS